MNKSHFVLSWFSIIVILLLSSACSKVTDSVLEQEISDSSANDSSDTQLSSELETGSSIEKTDPEVTPSSSTQGNSTLSSFNTPEISIVSESSSTRVVSSSDAKENSSSSSIRTQDSLTISSSDEPTESSSTYPDFANWGLPGPTIPHGFGVNIHFRANSPQLDQIADAGIKIIRMDLFWHKVERQKGKFDWSQYDALVEGCEQRGLQLLFILNYSNKNYEEYGNSVWTYDGRVAWTNYASKAVERYKGKNIIWELWNEPNIHVFWAPDSDAKAYMKLMNMAVPAIKKADPNAILLGSATAHIDLGWIEQTFQLGMLNHIDAVSVHPYRHQDPETVRSEYDKLNALIDGYTGGKGRPIVSSEWGYSNINWDGNPLSDFDQAQRLVRELLTNISKGVNLSIWYDWKNDGTDAGNREHNFGLVENDLTPKKAYHAYKTLNTVLNGYTFSKRIDSGTPGVYFLKFKKGSDTIYVFWKEGPQETRDIQSSLGRVEIKDLFGERKIIKWKGSSFPYKFTNAPQYMIVPGE
ncbi:MAG: glycoside hydrolase family 5 protein [Fibrobacterales bacterium]